MMQHTVKQRRPLRAALLLGLCAAVIFQTTVLARQCEGVRQSVLRLHVLANSDNAADQLLKLRVRDRLLADGAPLLAGAQNRDQAADLAKQQTAALQALAADELARAGSRLGVTCRVERAYFPTRVYGTVTLPAGEYTALRVVIGSGRGQNWWCVMFPPLCLPAACPPEDAPTVDSVLTDGEADLVQNGPRYRVRFKTVEWVEAALQALRDWL